MEIITREDFIARVTKLVDKEAISALTDLYLKSLEVKDSAKKATKQKAESKTRQARKSGKRVIQIGNVHGTSLDKILEKAQKAKSKSDTGKSTEIKQNKELKSFEFKSSVANDLIRKYGIGSCDHTMKRYYIINRISYSVNLPKNTKIKFLGFEKILSGRYTIDSYVDNTGNHMVMKGFF